MLVVNMLAVGVYARRQIKRLLAVATVVALLVAGCGESHSDHQGSAATTGTETDRAFLNDMTPHHRAAIEMAEMAEQRAQHAELQRLVASILADQLGEIEEMGELKQQVAAGGDGSHLRLSEKEMGMSMHARDLKRARPFDRAFIDAMVPHHEGAIAMAKLELAKGKNPEVRALARRIIETQQGEIAQMNAWRTRWYGAPVPKSSAPHAGGHEM